MLGKGTGAGLGFKCVGPKLRSSKKDLVAGKQARSLRSSSGERKLWGSTRRLSGGALSGGEVSRRAVRMTREGWRAALLRGSREKGENSGGPGSYAGRCGVGRGVGVYHREAGGARTPRAFLITPDPRGEEVPVPLFPNIADKTFRRICCKKPNYWHLSVFWANRPAVTVNNETLHEDVLYDISRGLGQKECIHIP